MGGQFRYAKWDLLLNITQIICLQCLFYAGIGFLMIFCSNIMNDILSMDNIFDSQKLNFKSKRGAFIASIFAINALFSCVTLWRVVQRSKLCLDFSCTLFLYHLLLCSWYSGRLPVGAGWWLTQLVCCAITCVCAELLCMRTEMTAVPVSMATNRSDL